MRPVREVLLLGCHRGDDPRCVVGFESSGIDTGAEAAAGLRVDPYRHQEVEVDRLVPVEKSSGQILHELLAEQQRSQSIFTYVMVAIAAISLLVGGIGTMNIVLATVLERTREIGIRRSIGARRSDIVRQFLFESVLISIGGGMVGIAFGYFLSWLIARAAEWNTIVTPSSIAIAFGVSVAVGVVFGIYPARKASRIDPIEALRYE